MSLLPIPEGPLRSGYTTGACATACAKAALLAFLKQEFINEIEITLPGGEVVSFTMKSCEFDSLGAICSTIKDAGDDPDVTHHAEIGCKVSFNGLKEVKFLRGEGVGIVTLPGLSIAVGEPAINPVPRQMITSEINNILNLFKITRGVNVEVFVVNGRETAKKTLNSRVGILDGISILGTTGIVRPFSASAYIASITQGIDVAIANGCKEIVINSGGKSEKILKELFPHLPEFAFVQYGNWIGETLEKINSTPLNRVTIGIMLGKAVKLAKGELDTHSSKSSWDKVFIYKLAKESGYSEEICGKILNLNMAGRLKEVFDFNEKEPFYQKLAEYCKKIITNLIPGVEVKILLVGEKGTIF